MNHVGRALFAFVGVLAIASCSGQTTGSAITPSDPAAATNFSHNRPEAGVRALCAPAPRGQSSCDAVVRTGVRFDHPPAYRAAMGISADHMQAAAKAGAFSPLAPAQIQNAYNLPSSTAGKGQTVGIVDAFDDPTAESDLAAYRKQFNLPPCTTKNKCFRKLNQLGKGKPLPKADGNWAGEISLDLDMVSAVCPNCNIVLVESNDNYNSNLEASVATAAAAGAQQISNSYGGTEDASGAAAYSIKNTIITASTGDSSWFAGPQTPAAYSTVVAVGGTSLYPYTSTRGWFETAWTDGGSGCSQIVANPSWIPKSIKCAGKKRPTSDVAAVGDPYTGVLVYQTYPQSSGGFYVYGGTSVSSPIIASVYALAGNASKTGNGASLYSAPKNSLNDVIIGANGIVGPTNNAGQKCAPVLICFAGAGYDGPTGNGTPWGVKAF
jgi:hypothetical protein